MSYFLTKSKVAKIASVEELKYDFDNEEELHLLRVRLHERF